MNCPCCGQHIDAVPLSILDQMLSAPAETTVLKRLIRAYPGYVPMEALLTAVYGMRDHPDTAIDTMKMRISVMRRKLKDTGWTIPDARRGRAEFGEYRLVAA